jgi:hypothetical protein
MRKLFLEFKRTIKEASHTMWFLLKIMIPISIIVKLLGTFGVIEIIGNIFSPIMSVMGLPGEFGLVWTTAMITNIYGGLTVFFSFALQNTYTVAQVTVLGTMILVAHTLPIELRIVQKAGVRLWIMFSLRFFGAFILGWMLHGTYSLFNIHQNPAIVLWTPESPDSSLITWLILEVRNYLIVFIIIFGLLLLMKLLKELGIIKILNRLLEPALRTLGLSKEAAPIAIIGTALGISYGGALIVDEAKSSRLTKKDTLLSLSMMGLSHSLIEDTLLMITIGAAISGILFGRFVFTLLIIFLISKIINRLSDEALNKYLTC